MTRSSSGAAGSYEVDDAASSGAGFSVSPSEWYHFVVQKTTTNFELWVNAVKQLDRSGTFGDADVTDFDGLVIGGKADGSDGIDGRIDHVKIYKLNASGGLDAAEIWALYIYDNHKYSVSME
jgi:hypothetical protein